LQKPKGDCPHPDDLALFCYALTTEETKPKPSVFLLIVDEVQYLVYELGHYGLCENLTIPFLYLKDVLVAFRHCRLLTMLLARQEIPKTILMPRKEIPGLICQNTFVPKFSRLPPLIILDYFDVFRDSSKILSPEVLLQAFSRKPTEDCLYEYTKHLTMLGRPGWSISDFYESVASAALVFGFRN